ncbi:hypothetical protein Cni_G14851 [Canna indica]|uniref:Uncharacterized protein n=1 Tax=Canna indica TaxID=4628 RepID=A0AAQ3QCR6_9LILI|nr:hypothetical protein Cni_G14851 [Canna indica]
MDLNFPSHSHCSAGSDVDVLPPLPRGAVGLRRALPSLLLGVVRVHLLLPALLAAERRVPSVHEDVAVAGEGLPAEVAAVEEAARRGLEAAVSLAVVGAIGAEEPALRPRRRRRGSWHDDGLGLVRRRRGGGRRRRVHERGAS